MNNTFPLLRILNTLLLAGILATLVLILLRIPREPISIEEPISVLGVESQSGRGSSRGGPPPVQVEISQQSVY